MSAAIGRWSDSCGGSEGFGLDRSSVVDRESEPGRLGCAVGRNGLVSLAAEWQGAAVTGPVHTAPMRSLSTSSWAGSP
jgi:hypothetical protein